MSAPAPLCLARCHSLGDKRMYKRILLAYDGSDAGQKALLDCQDLAHWSQSALFLVAVMPLGLAFVGLEGGVYDAALEERERARYQAVLNDGLQRLAAAGYTACLLYTSPSPRD